MGLSLAGLTAGLQAQDTVGKAAFVPSPVTVSTLADTVDGHTYRVHLVQSGQTLYSIARAYHVRLDDIVKNSMGDTVRIGEPLYIPYRKMQSPLDVAANAYYVGVRPAAFRPNPNMLVILPDTTVDAVTTSVPIGHAEAALTAEAETEAPAQEPDAMPVDTLRTGEGIPATAETSDTVLLDSAAVTTASVVDSLYYIWGADSLPLTPATTAAQWDSLFQRLSTRQSLSVAILLPLYLHDTLEPPVRSYVYLPFLEGWMTAYGEQLAASSDSLMPAVRYRVWDVTDAPESVNQALNDPDLAQADFLIAAVYTKVFDTIRRFAQAHRLPLIHPLTEQDAMAAGHPFFVQSLPSYGTQAESMAQFLKREFPPSRYRYVLFDDSTAFYRKRAQQLEACLTTDTAEPCRLWHYSLAAARMGQLETAFDSLFDAVHSAPTVFIGCSDKEIALLNTLIALKKTGGSAEKIFIGPSRWMSFTKIEPEYFKNLRLICYQPFYWDKASEASLRLERHYYAHFGVLPSDLAYKGYTCYRWFADMLRQGTVTADPFKCNRWRVRETGGWENARLFWLELKDHAFVLWPEPEPDIPDLSAPSSETTDEPTYETDADRTPETADPARRPERKREEKRNNERQRTDKNTDE